MDIHSGISCRICKSSAGQDLMRSPCLCKGTLGYVHFTCLEGWLNQASRDYCELCHFRFQASQSRRYSMLQSMWIWVSNRTNRSYLCYDALIALVLTALTVAIIFICLMGAGISSRVESSGGLEDPFVRVIIMLFLIILMASYITTLYLIIQDHVKPWYHWWRSCVNVQLLIDPNKFVSTAHRHQTEKVSSTLPAVDTHSKELLSLIHSESCQSVKNEKNTDISKSVINIQKKISNANIA